MRLLVFVVLVVLVATSCATVQKPLPLPSPPSIKAPLAERDAYYELKKPLGIAGVPSAENNLGLLVQPRFPTVILADGSRVSDPEVLLPAVGADSATAVAARKVADLKLLTNTLWTGSVVAFSAGLAAVMISPIAIVNEANLVAGVGLYAGGAAVALIGGLGLGWATELAEDAEAEKMAAFFLYEPDLRRRLGLVRPDEALDKKWLAPVRSKEPPESNEPPTSVLPAGDPSEELSPAPVEPAPPPLP